MSRHPNLEQIIYMEIGEIAKLSPSELSALVHSADEELRHAKMVRDWLDGAIALKYRERAEAQRNLEGKPFGTIRLVDEGYAVVCDIPKKADWDQHELGLIARRIRESGGDETEYVDVTYRVPERKYSAWPEHIRESFEKARILKAGKAVYNLKPIEGGLS